ncbi:MAG: hypothetical protein OEY14_05835, partial [Myxococcales bacterium]|nr:hypothetical protein [Myxococcales bacterium]
LLLGEPAPDPPGDPLLGDGSPARPFLVDRLPFVHGSSTLFSDHRALNLYSGCAASQDESGPEQLYRLVLDAPRTLRVMVFDRGSVDVDLHLLAAPSEAECLLRDHEIIVTTLDAGTHFLSVDTFVGSDGIERSGDYLLVIMEE